MRDVQYVADAKRYDVSIKQRKNGQYVVVERFPITRTTRRDGVPTFTQSMVESEVKLNSLKPGWMPSPQSKIIGRYDYHSLPALPPINLGWRDRVNAVVGSLDNYHHKPGGGDKVVPTQKLHWQAKAKVGSMDYLDYKSPRSHSSHIDPNLQRKSVKFKPLPRYGALASTSALRLVHYTPGGAQVVTHKQRFDHVRPRIGSLENITHVPAGGDITVPHFREKWRSEARIGSLDNIHHVPAGGNTNIINHHVTWHAKSRVGSLDNITHTPRKSIISIPRNKTNWNARSRIGSLENIHHKPGGGNIHIENNHLVWRAQVKVDCSPPKTDLSRSRSSSFSSLDGRKCE